MEKKAFNDWLSKGTIIYSKFSNMKTEKVKEHPFFKYLREPKKYYNTTDISIISSRINLIEECIQKIKTLRNHSHIIKNIFEPEHFYGALTELETASYFIDKNCDVLLEPPISDSVRAKRMDMKVKLKDRFVSIECYCPRTDAPIWEYDDNLPIGEDDYVNKSLKNTKRKIGNKVERAQYTVGGPNILLIDISQAKWGMNNNTIDILTIKEMIKKEGFFEKNNQYGALVVYDTNSGDAGPFRWVIQNPLSEERLQLDEIKMIGHNF